MTDEDARAELARILRAVPLRTGAWLDLRIVADDLAEHIWSEGYRKTAERHEREWPERRLAVPEHLLDGWRLPMRVDDPEGGP